MLLTKGPYSGNSSSEKHGGLAAPEASKYHGRRSKHEDTGCSRAPEGLEIHGRDEIRGVSPAPSLIQQGYPRGGGVG